MWSFNRTPANALEIFLQVSGQEAFTIFWCNNLLLLFAPTVLSKKKAGIWLIYLLFIYHNTDKWSHTSFKQMYVCTGFFDSMQAAWGYNSCTVLWATFL